MQISNNDFVVFRKPSVLVSCSSSDLSFLQCKLFDIIIGAINNSSTKPNSIFKVMKKEKGTYLKVNLVALRNIYIPNSKLVDVKRALIGLIDMRFIINILKKVSPSNIDGLQAVMVFIHTVMIFKPSLNMRIYISNQLYKYLSNINSNYLIVNIKRSFQFTGKYAYILYQLIADYKGTAKIKGKINLPVIGFTQLKKILKIRSQSYQELKIFNRNILNPAIREINEKADKGIVDIKFNKFENGLFYKYDKYTDRYEFNVIRLQFKEAKALNTIFNDDIKKYKMSEFKESKPLTDEEQLEQDKLEIKGFIIRHFMNRFHLESFESFYRTAVKRNVENIIYIYLRDNEYDWNKYLNDVPLDKIYKILLNMPRYMCDDGYLRCKK